MILRAFTEGKKPDKGANDKHDHGVGDEDPVENDETNRDMVTLDDCSDGQEAREQERNTNDKSTVQVGMTKSHVQKQIVPPPQEREYNG